jgi:hypothetical protein
MMAQRQRHRLRSGRLSGLEAFVWGEGKESILARRSDEKVGEVKR